METKKILICTTTHFPNHDAGSIYYTNIGKCLVDDGDKILFVGNGFTDYKKTIIDEKTGFSYLSLRNSKKNVISKIISHLFIKSRIINFIFKHSSDIDLLLLDGSFSVNQYNKIINHFKKKQLNTKIVIGILEKYSLDEFDNKLPIVWSMVKNNNRFIDRFNNKESLVLVISSCLEQVFKARGLNCVRVPFIFDSATMINYLEKSKITKSNEKIRIIYAGHPSNKDLLCNIFLGITMLPAEYLHRIYVDIIGVKNNYFIERGINSELLSKYSDSIKIWGKLDHQHVEELYKIADYSILVRDDEKQFSKAGFPTKISESLYYNVIPITNISSDLAMYLFDQKNSIIIKGYNTDEICNALIVAIESYGNIGKMRIEAQNTLVEHLSIKSNKDNLLSAIYNLK